MSFFTQKEIIKKRRALEKGAVQSQGKRSIALVYPSPYAIGMSSLGFQSIFYKLNQLPDTVAERAFLLDNPKNRVESIITYESLRCLGEFPVIAFSLSYELEITGVFQCLENAGVSIWASQRGEQAPWVIIGGPLTRVNVLPLAKIADVIVVGEAEDILEDLIDAIFSDTNKAIAKKKIAKITGCYVPEQHKDRVPTTAIAGINNIPAFSCLWTPESTLKNMFLVEVTRGCSRACQFCVMQNKSSGGMRVIPLQKILSCIPEDAARVGLVGAAVSDHPDILALIEQLINNKKEIGLSSLRADRLDAQWIELLLRGGYRTITIAADGISERLRRRLDKRIQAVHLLNVAKLAYTFSVPRIKIYAMVGVPDENEYDVQEFVALLLAMKECAGHKTQIVLALSPFVPKKNTALVQAPFLAIRFLERRMQRIKQKCGRHIVVRAASARWAWVEYMVAQGNAQTGPALYHAWTQGGRFSDYKKYLSQLSAFKVG